MTETEFENKARQHLFNARLTEAPLVAEMYVRAFGLTVSSESLMADVIDIIRESKTKSDAFEKVCQYLADQESYLADVE